MRARNGFTAIELLIAVSILTLLTAIILPVLSGFRKKETLLADAESVMELIAKARHDTLGAKMDMRYGVHLATTSVTYFVGTTYDSATTTNIVYNLDSGISIAGITLTGGGSDILFERLTGATQTNGTFRLEYDSDTTASTTITLTATGLFTAR
jgi:prepilin-type N-terminal cleavage/methylation domain-containing protein